MVRNEKPTTPRIQSRDELIKLCRGVSKNSQVIRAMVGIDGYASVKQLMKITGFCGDDINNAVTVAQVQRGCLFDKIWVNGRVQYHLAFIGEKIQRESDERHRNRERKARGKAARNVFSPRNNGNFTGLIDSVFC